MRTLTMSISQSQAVEVAEKYLLIKDKIVLRDYMTVTKSPDGWHVTAKTMPAMIGKSTETIQFTIDGETGEIRMPISRSE
jgi:hypothetical protein